MTEKKRGGARPNSGRKKQNAPKPTDTVLATRATQATASVEGEQPSMLDILTSSARHFMHQASVADAALVQITDQLMQQEGGVRELAELLKQASALRMAAIKAAAEAAPYLHAKVAPVQPQTVVHNGIVPLAERLRAYARERKERGEVIELRAS